MMLKDKVAVIYGAGGAIGSADRVTAVAASAGGAPLGMTATSFTSVSLDPPIVSVCIAHSSTTSLLAARRVRERRPCYARAGPG